MDRLVLVAYSHKGTGAPEIQARTRRVEQLRASNRRKPDADMIRSIFTRDGHASSYDPADVPEKCILVCPVSRSTTGIAALRSSTPLVICCGTPRARSLAHAGASHPLQE